MWSASTGRECTRPLALVKTFSIGIGVVVSPTAITEPSSRKRALVGIGLKVDVLLADG